MNCPKCGAELLDNCAFCTTCGAPVNAGNTAAPAAPAVPAVPAVPAAPATPMYISQPVQPISIGGWIGRSLIAYIPFVGGIIYLIMLFVWMGDNTKDETFRNWAKAQLILTAIAIVLVIFICIFFGALIASLISSELSNIYY